MVQSEAAAPPAAPESPFQWYRDADSKTRRVFWTCMASWATDMGDAGIFQYLIPVLILGLGISMTQTGIIASANYFAAAIGGWMGGWLCDRFGRARILQLTILWFSGFTFLSGFAQNFDQLLVIRIVQGLGFGAEWAVGATLLGELVRPKDRGKALGTVHSGGALGSAMAAFLAGPFASLFAPALAWRMVFWVGVLPALLIFFVRRGSDDFEVFIKARRHSVAIGRHTSLVSIFTPKMIRVTLFASLLAVGAQGAGFSVGNYLTAFLSIERGLSIKAAGFLVLLNSLGGFVGVLVNAYISDRVGRRKVFRIYGVGFVLSAAAYLFAPLGNSIALLIPAGFVNAFFQFGMYASFAPYFTELFPTEIRGTGQAFVYNFGRAVSASFILGIALLARSIPLSASMAVFGSFGIFLALIATVFLPETAGRELQGLDDIEKPAAATAQGGPRA